MPFDKKPSRKTLSPRTGNTPRKPKFEPGLPTRQQVLDFISNATEEVGKREIAKAFGLKGQEKIQLKALLKDMADEGLIDGKRTAYHRMGGVPKVTVLRVVDIEDGEPIAIPDNWEPDDATPPPRLRIVEPRGSAKKGPATRGIGPLKPGDRILARTEEAGAGWLAHAMKKMPSSLEAVMGVVELDGAGKGWLAPVDKRERHASPISDLGGAEAGQLVLAEPAGRSPRAGMRVTAVLGDPLAPKAFSLIAIHKHGIPHVFTSEVVSEAELSAKQSLSREKREDLTHLPIVAIDPSDARDHDDAIWAEEDGQGGWRAVVAIADVSFYVRPGGALDREARKRGNSVYFPDRVVPMLPEVLSADVCSLKAGAPRAAMACHMTFDSAGKMTSFRFTRAIVQIAEVIAYEEAQARIDEARAQPHLVSLWGAWAALAKAREARDPLNLELPERRVMLDEKGRITSIALRERLDAHRVVEDFMIAANVAAAKALESKVAPVVYRIHEPPNREKLIALKDYLATFERKLSLGQVITPALFNRMLSAIEDEAEKALIMEAVLRSQTQAYYGPRNAGHFGLGLGSYSHFTSPIRRYSDLLVHRALVDSFGLEQPAPHEDLPEASGLHARDGADLGKICDAISVAERRAMTAERETIDRYVAAWLATRVGEVFDCRITGVQRFGLFATIISLGGDGLVPISVLGDERFFHDEKAQALEGERTGTRFSMGDRIRLRLAEANPLTGALKFEPEDSEGRIEARGGHREDKPKREPLFKRGNHLVGKRGRPANIRHQGKKKR
ncbi:VacB/RNase II family 3'-5' exoribonuclease [Novosphingobium umbonatum]|uniref:Ribonuclease R n=1 Tax=Novosphingobium umbonatum TaxID=1908524 RepID=A0A437N8L3_9SPHN|nr:VacB/RNase II family 3'-5' exoribonuclease [Novosphingobium umbonatum]RVU06248.1 VacB/RNase II family 3'-5' exoribonuclease [Novosphingobium umbonatum]